MDTGIIEGVLLWAAQLSQSHQLNLISSITNGVTSVVISNIILILYVAVFIKRLGGRYLAAFLICELFGHSYVYQSNTGYEIYFGYVFVYSILYWVLDIRKERLNTRLACGIIVLFDARMTLHAYFNGDYEAFIYVYYEYITLATHYAISIIAGNS